MQQNQINNDQTIRKNMDIDEVKITPKEYEDILNFQNEILGMLASHDNYKDILNRLCKLAESLLPNAVSSIMLLNDSTELLSVLAAPTVPEAGLVALKNLKPGPGGGSCGNAVFKNQPQYVRDTFSDDRWSDLRKFAYDFNLCSCWSMPVRNQNKKAIGTFALSSFEHRSPSSFHKKLLQTAAYIVSIVLKNKESDIRIKLFSKAMENAVEGMAITDEKNNFIEINQAFEKIYNLEKAKVIGKNPKILASGKYPQAFYDSMWNSIRKNHKWSGEIINKKADNTQIVQWLSISALYDENNNVYNYLAIFSDLTEIKKKERQLIKSEKMAAMGEMIGNIAHQWRQPLSVISTASTGMKMQQEFNTLKSEDIPKMCDAINDNAQYLSKTIDDFRNFIKGDRTKKIFDLKKGIDSFLHLVEGSIKNNNINIILNLEEDIKIDGYKNELIQCLINIFNNSKDALKEKVEKDRLLFISTSTNDNKAIIKIKDNAGGIPKDIINRVFEAYFTTKHQSQGTGLGLHMTYNLIVDGMGGTIEANNVNYTYEDKSYVGAEFLISLSND